MDIGYCGLELLEIFASLVRFSAFTGNLPLSCPLTLFDEKTASNINEVNKIWRIIIESSWLLIKTPFNKERFTEELHAFNKAVSFSSRR